MSKILNSQLLDDLKAALGNKSGLPFLDPLSVFKNKVYKFNMLAFVSGNLLQKYIIF